MASISFEDFFVLRRPLLPLQAALTTLDTHPSKESFREILRITFAEPLVAEALYLASPALSERLNEWLMGKLIAEENKLIQSLTKYYLRMSSRCTPYGLFAGCTSGQFGPRTNVIVDGLRRYTRLDMNYVAGLSQWLLALPGVAEQLRYFPNTSLHHIGDQYRYMACQIQDKQRSYSLLSAEAMPEIETVLNRARAGATLSLLASSLEESGIGAEEAAGFVNELVAAQVLVSELEPTVTGDEFFKRLMARTESLSGLDPIGQALHQVDELLAKPDGSVAHYHQIQQVINEHLIPTDNQHLFQTDLYFNTAQTDLSDRVATQLAPALTRLLTIARTQAIPDLERFKRDFYDRYEEQEVPLLLALDSEAGIPYGDNAWSGIGHTPLIDNLSLAPSAGSPTDSGRETTWTAFLIDAFTAAMRSGSPEVRLTDEDLARLASPTATDSFSPSLYAFGTLLAASPQAIDKGEFDFVLNTLAGPSAANLLSRFCHGDAYLTEKVRACLADEANQYPDAILAEIVHLPEARTGNVLMRPILRPFEIPYLAAPAVEPDAQLTLDDLLISVPQGKQVVIRSRRLQRRVIPRLTSAHNFTNGLPIYKFLADVQHQEGSLHLKWHWSILHRQTYLPRVRYGNIILSRAIWNLTADVHQAATVAAFAALQERLGLNLPRYVVLCEGDNEMLLDLNHELCVSILQETLRKNRSVQLSEFLQTPDRCWLTDAAGCYTNEIIFPLRSVRKATTAVARAHDKLPDQAIRYSVGSHWLYFKIYTGEKTADTLLASVIEPLTRQWLEEGVIDRFFFVRYRDPQPHIRLRLRGKAPQSELFHQLIISQLHTTLEPYSQQGLVHNTVVDTYRPEIERYGKETMTDSEHVFHVDSLAVVRLLQELTDDSGEEHRWLFAIRGVDDLLNGFSYTLSDKHRLLTELQATFFSEFGGDAALRNQLNTKYRTVTGLVSAVLVDAGAVLPNPLPDLLASRSQAIQQIAATLLPKLQTPDPLLASYIHMFLNRLFISSHRLHELVIYHFLFRQYAARTARNTAKTS